MGIFTYNKEELKEKVASRFNETKNYVVAKKNNSMKNRLLKLSLSSLVYVMDSSRTFILYFSEKGIYEKEISNSLKGDFYLIPWHEIENFSVTEKKDKVILDVIHLGKRYGYEIDYNGRFYEGNKEIVVLLLEKNWNKIDKIKKTLEVKITFKVFVFYALYALSIQTVFCNSVFNPNAKSAVP